MFEQEDFFNDELLAAIKEAESEILPLGEHRFQVMSVRGETYNDKDGLPIKFLVMRGVYADDGGQLTARFPLLGKNGAPNPFALRDLGRGFIESGIKRSLPDICNMRPDEFPVVLLRVFEERYNKDDKEHTVIKKSITKCQDQTKWEPPKAKPQGEPVPVMDEPVVITEGGVDEPPF
jgi:hypothetical protein